MATLIDGKQTALAIQEEIRQEVVKLKAEGKKTPHLAAVLVGEDGASQTYVNSKIQACERVGFNSSLLRLNPDISQSDLLSKIDELNENPDIDGFIVQLPLPAHIDVAPVIERIRPEKDVDGFHPINVGRLIQELPAYVSATPFGIIKLLSHYGIETSGKHCVVLGRSNIVGRPMSILLSQNHAQGNATVTLCHSRTQNLASITRQADILVVALGKPEFVKADMVKDGAVVIDVGTTRVKDESRKRGYRVAGDVDFTSVEPKASFISPVPGGVGPMTVTGLLLNTLRAAKGEVY